VRSAASIWTCEHSTHHKSLSIFVLRHVISSDGRVIEQFGSGAHGVGASHFVHYEFKWTREESDVRLSPLMVAFLDWSLGSFENSWDAIV